MAYMNYGSEQHDSISPEVTYLFWCEKCLDYHGTNRCLYDDYDYCPHCGQLISIRRQP